MKTSGRSGRIATLRTAVLCAAVSCACAKAALAAYGLQARMNDAAEGATLRIDGGRHQGPLRIDKPLTLIGVNHPVIEGDRSGHVVHILADDVSIEGFVIRASGSDLGQDHAGVMVEGDNARIERNRIQDTLHGIYLKKASGCRVAGNRIFGKRRTIEPIQDVIREGTRPVGDALCAIPLGVHQRGNGIHLWDAPDNRIENNRIEHTRDGIYFSFSDRTIVRGNRVQNVRYGLHYMYSDENVFENNHFERNAAGAAIMYSKGIFVRGNTFANNRGRRAYGLLLQSVDDTVFRHNLVERNTVGVYLENSNRCRFLLNSIAANYIGVRMTASSSDNAFGRNRFTDNLHGVELDRNVSGNEWAPNGTGNYWAGAAALDLDGDGRSELPHHEADPLGSIRPGFPQVGLLSRAPALQLIRFAQSRAPVPGLPAIEDPAPLARPPETP